MDSGPGHEVLIEAVSIEEGVHRYLLAIDVHIEDGNAPGHEKTGGIRGYGLIQERLTFVVKNPDQVVKLTDDIKAEIFLAFHLGLAGDTK